MICPPDPNTCYVAGVLHISYIEVTTCTLEVRSGCCQSWQTKICIQTLPSEILSEQFSLDVRRWEQSFRPSQQLVWIEQEDGMPLQGGLQRGNETVRFSNVFEYEKHYCCLAYLWKDLENISDGLCKSKWLRQVTSGKYR